MVVLKEKVLLLKARADAKHLLVEFGEHEPRPLGLQLADDPLVLRVDGAHLWQNQQNLRQPGRVPPNSCVHKHTYKILVAATRTLPAHSIHLSITIHYISSSKEHESPKGYKSISNLYARER